MPQGQRGGGAGFWLKVWQIHIPLSLSCFLGYPLPIGLTRADPGKSGRTIATPPKTGGSCGPGRGEVWHASIRPHEGSLSSSLLIPAGRPGIAPRRGRANREGEKLYEMAES